MNKVQSLQKREPVRIASSAFAIALGLAGLAGCSSEPNSHVVSAPPPATPPAVVAPASTVQVQTTSGSASPSTNSPSAVIVTQAPPVPQTEPVLVQPSPKHVWIPGYWQYQDNRYVWIAGRWELPPHEGDVWVAPRWEREGTGYRYYDGYWR